MAGKSKKFAWFTLDRPVCLNCLTTRTEMSIDETKAILELIETTLTVRTDVGRCLACGEKNVHIVSVDRPVI